MKLVYVVKQGSSIEGSDGGRDGGKLVKTRVKTR